jgi:phosphate transport system permease protein
MAIASPPSTSPSGAPKLTGGPRPPGAFGDRVFRYLAFAGGFLVFVVLALIAYATVSKAWPAISDQGLDYFFSDNWNQQEAAFGTLAFTYGTVVISVIALLIAVPVSVGIALFVTEVAPRWMRRPVVYLVDLLAAVPSVVFGLWGLRVFAPELQSFYSSLHDAVGGVPILGDVLDGDPISGRSFMTAGIVLAIMITPIITAITRETFTTVPSSLKDASLAMGATRWEMIKAAVLPHSRSGMVAAILIGLGRAIGETIAVALVIGSSPQITEKILGSGDALPAVIANQFPESTGTYQAALIGMGVVLFGITIVVGVVARAVLARGEKHQEAL